MYIAQPHTFENIETAHICMVYVHDIFSYTPPLVGHPTTGALKKKCFDKPLEGFILRAAGKRARE